MTALYCFLAILVYVWGILLLCIPAEWVDDKSEKRMEER